MTGWGLVLWWLVTAATLLLLFTGCAARQYYAYPPAVCTALGGAISQQTVYRGHGWWLTRTWCSFPVER